MPCISSLQRPGAMPADIPWDEFDFAMVESPSQSLFLGRPRVASEAREFPIGVAFGKHSELRWRRRGGNIYHMVYVSDSERPLPGVEKPTGIKRLQEEGQILLWSAGDLRIPSTPEYPGFEGSPRLALCTIHYDLDGTRFHRFAGIRKVAL